MCFESPLRPTVDRQIFRRNMERWLIRLSGHQYDLEEMEKYFPEGDVCVIHNEEGFFLTGRRFENLQDERDVRGAAERSIEEVAAVISLLKQSFRKPTYDSVIRTRADNGQDVFVHLSGGLEMRSKVSCVIVRASEGEDETGAARPISTPAQQMLAQGIHSPHLQRALRLWAAPNRSWTHLNAILEEVENQIGTTVSHQKLCSAAERDRFTRTANNAEAAGLDARHGSGKFQTPRSPMTLEEAGDFIRKLLGSQLRPKNCGPSSSI